MIFLSARVARARFGCKICKSTKYVMYRERQYNDVPGAATDGSLQTLGCFPTTVGGVRREMGLTGERRSVQRQGGQIYEMKPAKRSANRSQEHSGK